jgi:hypothetical protein
MLIKRKWKCIFQYIIIIIIIIVVFVIIILPTQRLSDFVVFMLTLSIPVTVRSKAQVCGHSPAETVDSNPTVDMDVSLL